MKQDPKKIAVELMFCALGEILKDVDSGRTYFGDKPEERKFDNYDLLGFSILRAPNEDPTTDLYFVGMKIRLPDCYPHDAYEVMKKGPDIYMRSNGKMNHLCSFSGLEPKAVSNDMMMQMFDRALHENTELLEAVESLSMRKYDPRKKRK